MLYNITNGNCKNMSTGDFITFLTVEYPDKSLSSLFYEELTVQDSANNCYSIVVLNNTENDYALIDTKKGIGIVIDDVYIPSYKALLDKLLEDGYKITYEK